MIKYDEILRLKVCDSVITPLQAVAMSCVDPKSILGIFSLDLTAPICLNIYAEGNEEQSMAALAGYII